MHFFGDTTTLWFFYCFLCICKRICHCEGDIGAPLLAPCYCSGSLRYVHQACLQQWIKASDTRACELCKFTFIMNAKTKPFSEVGYNSLIIFFPAQIFQFPFIPISNLSKIQFPICTIPNLSNLQFIQFSI